MRGSDWTDRLISTTTTGPVCRFDAGDAPLPHQGSLPQPPTAALLSSFFFVCCMVTMHISDRIFPKESAQFLTDKIPTFDKEPKTTPLGSLVNFSAARYFYVFKIFVDR